jgi:hypothetical protein
MTLLTHPGTFAALNATPAAFAGRPSFAGGLWGFVRGGPFVPAILEPWVACARRRECIAPEGAGLANHRFDQSAVSVIT